MIFQNTPQKIRNEKNIVELLQETNQIIDFGLGQAGFSGIFLEAMSFFERIFLALAHKMKAQECVYPQLIHVNSLHKHNYFSQFPQFIAFALHVKKDEQVLQSFAQSVQKGLPQNLGTYLDFPEWVLRPAVCFHVYEQLENQQIDLHTPQVFTTQGQCFRHETTPSVPSRLHTFTMREIVLVGATEFITVMRKELMAVMHNLLRALDLAGYTEVAADPFFTNRKSMALYQKLGELKYELNLDIPFEKTRIAAASFNLHHDFFTKAHNISSQSNEPVCTGCFAFGIERWAFAFLAQYGLDSRVQHYLNTTNINHLIDGIWENRFESTG